MSFCGLSCVRGLGHILVRILQCVPIFNMEKRRTHVSIPEGFVSEIDALVGKRGRSEFLVQAAEKELVRHRQMTAVQAAAGAWKTKDYPELNTSKDVADFVSKLRKGGDARLKQQG